MIAKNNTIIDITIIQKRLQKVNCSQYLVFLSEDQPTVLVYCLSILVYDHLMIVYITVQYS
jgi:hypothetical protein